MVCLKIWSKVHLKDQNKEVELISKSLTNYIYGTDSLSFIFQKYGISKEDRKIHAQNSANRIAGLLMLYLANDTKRINDIVNKYNLDTGLVHNILPEIEGYINQEKKI